MFLRSKIRRKDGKEHRSWSVVENRRVASGRVVQRHVLYLGEINSTQELAWRRSIEVIETGTAQPRTLSLFPEDRCDGLLPDGSIVRLKLSQVRLRRPRQWGACWLALELWRELGLDRFWAERLDRSRKGTRWDQVLLVLVAYRLLAPGSEWRLHREWFERTGLADLLGEDAGPSTSSGGREPQALSLPRPAARAQSSGVHASDRTLARPVQRLIRRAALRLDQYLFRERPAVPGRRQASLWPLARPPPRLRAGHHRAGGDPGGISARLRGAAGQHQGRHDAARFSRSYRAAIWQSAADLADGPGRADRGGAGRDARRQSTATVSGRHAKRAADPAGKGSRRQALAGRPARRASQATAPGWRTLRLRPERRPRCQGTSDAPSPAEMAVGTAQATHRYETDARGTADAARCRSQAGQDGLAPARDRGGQGQRHLQPSPRSREAAPGPAARRSLSIAHQSHRRRSGAVVGLVSSARQRRGGVQKS